MDEQGLRINDTIYSTAEASVDLTPLGGPKFATDAFSAFDYEEAGEGEEVMGFGRRPLGATAGDIKSSASMTMFLEESIRFQDALKAIAVARGAKDPEAAIYLIPFDVDLSFEPLLEGGDSAVITVKMRACRLTKRSVKLAAGTSSVSKEMPLMCTGGIYESRGA